jgi:hypothetical protein
MADLTVDVFSVIFDRNVRYSLILLNTSGLNFSLIKQKYTGTPLEMMPSPTAIYGLSLGTSIMGTTTRNADTSIMNRGTINQILNGLLSCLLVILIINRPANERP